MLLGVVGWLPAFATALVLLWSGDYSTQFRWLVAAALFVTGFGVFLVIRQKIRFPLTTLANLVSAIREGDFSIRARADRRRGALGELAAEVNLLAASLREQRFDRIEISALLRAVMSEIDVAVFAFDPGSRLVLVNSAGEKVLGKPSEQLQGRLAREIGLNACLEGESNFILGRSFPGGGDRWSVRRGLYRQNGLPHQLVVLTDLSRTLREEERQAWQRLLRVLGHELNNSLAPIKSISGSLETLIQKEQRPADWEEDMRRGLSVISSRTAGLTRFMEAYAQLAKLPPPRRSGIDLTPILQRVARLEGRIQVAVTSQGPIQVEADADQLEQLLINLVRNATDAALQLHPGPGGGSDRSDNTSERGRVLVSISHAWHPGAVEILIEDSGPGVANPANLFVPFFTTKPGGSGIGLVLSRQIAEAHGGTLTLENRTNSRGCVARLRLPSLTVSPAPAAAATSS